ncbi:LANO_0E03180g1_1 [Lachancea nothofagi CBS 11611]|uniref:LANO_0E03180g1_1 n=1 Tax=Lachancea nothofagi CBS 11611 TaxID=1266666 RepID=A0A1G4JR29_9SACH|nr:LANO_0E03180g1_1 [Lachancea nothofagi CBS 11611]
MSYLTPPISMTGLNQSSNIQNFILDTPNSQQLSSEGSEMSLKVKNNICKSFEDDVFFCPRMLLSSQEQSKCQKMDQFLLDQMREVGGSRLHEVSFLENLNSQPKFNPYTSQSFSPAPPPFEHQSQLHGHNGL